MRLRLHTRTPANQTVTAARPATTSQMDKKPLASFARSVDPDDDSLYDDEEPAFPYRKKIQAYPSESKEAVSIYFLMEDLQNGKVIDARRMTGFPTLLRDGIVTPDGLLSEEVLEEIELYKEYHERRGREIRARREAHGA